MDIHVIIVLSILASILIFFYGMSLWGRKNKIFSLSCMLVSAFFIYMSCMYSSVYTGFAIISFLIGYMSPSV